MLKSQKIVRNIKSLNLALKQTANPKLGTKSIFPKLVTMVCYTITLNITSRQVPRARNNVTIEQTGLNNNVWMRKVLRG